MTAEAFWVKLEGVEASTSSRDFCAIFQDICKGDQHALAFCHVFLQFSHFQDDCVDKDHPPSSPEAVLRLALEWIMVLSLNPFFLANKQELLPLIRSGARAYLDSIEWSRKDDLRERLMAKALEVQYGEVLWAVARITGGPEHYADTTRKYRHFTFDLGLGDAPKTVTQPGSIRPISPATKEICAGDSDAEKFAHSFLTFCRLLDDVIDGDSEWHPEDVVKANLDFIEALASNAFFERHKSFLLPLILTSARCWGDSIEWLKRPDIRERCAANVLAAEYHNVLFAVAYCVAGFDHYSAMTLKFRDFHYDL